MIIGGVTYYASLLPDRGQEEIFADPANSRVCGAGSPTSIRSADGRRLTHLWKVSICFRLLALLVRRALGSDLG
jgi:hypothetical protein